MKVNAKTPNASEAQKEALQAKKQKHEEARWTKPLVKGNAVGVSPEKTLADTSVENLAYACRIFEKLNEKDPDSAKLFINHLVENLFQLKDVGNKEAFKIATDNTLKSMVQSGVITSSEAEILHDAGVKMAHDVSKENKGAEKKVASVKESVSSQIRDQETIDAPKGFLWKPISDSDKNLAILLPPGLSKKEAKVSIVEPNGKVTEGEYKGFGNGDRDHYRFKKPGSSFAPGSLVKIEIKGQADQYIKIPDTTKRTEGK